VYLGLNIYSVKSKKVIEEAMGGRKCTIVHPEIGDPQPICKSIPFELKNE
jgi:hypothetical protein